MKVDFGLIFRHNKAHRGHINSMCELAYYYSEFDDWQKVAQYFELLVDNTPEICETKFVELTNLIVPYETMLGLIGQAYYEHGNYSLAYRWFQKHLDYLDYKNLNNRDTWHIERKKNQVYEILLTDGELDKPNHRFMLKWEQELFWKKMGLDKKETNI